MKGMNYTFAIFIAKLLMTSNDCAIHKEKMYSGALGRDNLEKFIHWIISFFKNIILKKVKVYAK